MKRIFLLLFIIALASCSTLKVHDSSSKNSGFWYALPKNIVVVEIPVKKVSYKRKSCFDAVNTAFPQLNLAVDYPMASATAFSLGKPSITTRAVPDITKVFAMEASSRFVNNSNYTFIYSDLGVLNSTELQNENKMFDVVLETVNAVTAIAGNFLPKGKITNDGTECTQIIKLLEDIQTKRYTLLTIENRAFKDVFEKQLELLNSAESNLINTFVVETKKEEHNLRFNFTPTTTTLGRDLFKFNKDEGISLITHTTGAYEEESITDDILGKLQITGATFAVSETVRIDITNQATTNQLVDNRIMTGNNTVLEGFVFNVPASATGVLKRGTTSIGKSNLIIAQLGTTSRLTHKISKLSIELDPSTGALKKVSGQNTAVGADAIKKSGEAASNTISTFKKEKETELESLIKQRQILEEKKKIKDLKEEVDH